MEGKFFNKPKVNRGNPTQEDADFSRDYDPDYGVTVAEMHEKMKLLFPSKEKED